MEESVGGIDKWEVESAIDTLKRSKEIKENGKMMKAVKIQARRDQDALREVAELGKDRARRIGGMVDG